MFDVFAWHSNIWKKMPELLRIFLNILKSNKTRQIHVSLLGCQKKCGLEVELT